MANIPEIMEDYRVATINGKLSRRLDHELRQARRLPTGLLTSPLDLASMIGKLCPMRIAANEDAKT